MRAVTIKREKTYVGCVATVKLYIEDPISGNTLINGVNCRKLGELKNGEEKSFPIDTNAVRIFAVSDQLSRNYSNDLIKVPAGEEDCFFTGKYHFGWLAGNPFRFDGEADEEILENRKKNNKKGGVVMVIACLVGLLIGFFGVQLALGFDATSERTFGAEELRITLNSDFTKEEEEGFDGYFLSSKMSVVVLKDDGFSKSEMRVISVGGYGEQFMEWNDIHAEIEEKDGLVYCIDKTAISEDYSLDTYAFFYKSDSAFWIVQMIPLKNNEKTENDIFEWAKSVRFEEP